MRIINLPFDLPFSVYLLTISPFKIVFDHKMGYFVHNSTFLRRILYAIPLQFRCTHIAIPMQMYLNYFPIVL